MFRYEFDETGSRSHGSVSLFLRVREYCLHIRSAITSIAGEGHANYSDGRSLEEMMRVGILEHLQAVQCRESRIYHQEL